MKTKFFTRITLLAMMVSTAVFAGEPTTFNVDKAKSKIAWKGEKVTGEHVGEVKVASGTLQFNGQAWAGGTFTIDMTSITCTDLEDATYNEKLVGHLKSDDFFGVGKHPMAKLMIKEVVSKGKNNYEVVADITIKGITKEIKFPATVSRTGNAVNGKAEIVIDRSKFDIRYGSGSFFDNLGDKTIYDNFTLNVNLVANS
jgi:polyisoprenoid-binding protein YceI